ncbi:MAG TPA: Fe-S cluster assembly protein SufD [Candidatus Obscuribacterales bacterium]
MSEAELAEMIDRQRVEELTSKFQEPEWLRDNRVQAWETYLQTPMPSGREGDWKRIDLSVLDLTQLRAFDLAPAKQVDAVPALPSWITSAIETFGEHAGVLFQTTKNGGYIKLRSELAERGVIFCDLATAIEKHADKIRPYLLQDLKPGKFNLLTRALYNCGAFLYVPSGVEIKEPFIFGLGFSAHAEDIGAAIFPRVFVVAEDNSKVDVIFALGKESDQAVVGKRVSLASVVVDTHVKSGARLNLLEVQELGSDVFVVEDINSHVAKDAQFNSLSIGVGGQQTKSDIATYLTAQGANSDVLGVILGARNEHFNFNTIQEHNAPDTKSNINYRVAVKDDSSSVYQGIIRVDKIAQRTNAFQSNKNLILGGNATADSVPKLEILANDVKCSHGATVGPVDKEQLFYLQSRGMTPPEAEELVVLGFFRQVFEAFPIPAAHQWISDVVSRKVFRQ